MSNRIWTATVPIMGGMLTAQCKSSKAELIRRIRADDPVWLRATVAYVVAPRFDNKWFRRGLAFRFYK